MARAANSSIHCRYERKFFISANLRNYIDNVDGVGNRVKVRVRWYGDLFGYIERPVLELKMKEEFLVRKESFPLTPFSINESTEFEDIFEKIKRAEVPEALKLDLLSLQPTLLNRYSRRYFQSANGNYRITIDSDMEFYRINFRNNSFLNKSVDIGNTVLELKYDPDQEPYVDEITNYFLLRMTKSSKYVSGIERIHLW